VQSVRAFGFVSNLSLQKEQEHEGEDGKEETVKEEEHSTSPDPLKAIVYGISKKDLTNDFKVRHPIPHS